MEEMSYLRILVWPGGGTIGVILWLMSIVTAGIIIEHFITIRRINILPDHIRGRIDELLGVKRYRDVIDLTAAEPSFLSRVIHTALAEAGNGYPAMERAMEEAAAQRTDKLLRRIEWLNLIGNISPMLGLLGTVWGMINAFFVIVQAGDMPNPAAFAGPIGIALVTTLLGLAIAIPALAVYSVMRNRIDALSGEATVACQKIISKFHQGHQGPAVS